MKIGVLGVGHLGRIHACQLLSLPEWDVVGFFDPNDEHAQLAQQEFGLKRFNTQDELVDASEALDIVSPTLFHYDGASAAIRAGRHVFVEKPVAATPEEAKALMQLAGEAKVLVQVGHVERFNPAFRAAQPYLNNVMFVETHRLAQFNPRGTDVSVVLDLMIHDLDVVLSTVNSSVKRVSASGVAVVSNSPDICNARIEFNNGCVANLTASRISMKNMRKTRFFQRDAYISVDFLEKETSVVRLEKLDGEPGPMDVTIDLGPEKGAKRIYMENPQIEPTNAIRDELQSFHACIANQTRPVVSIEDGTKALEVAFQVLEKLRLNASGFEVEASK